MVKMTTDDNLLHLVEKFKGNFYKRPDHVKIPTVWTRFEGKTPRADGSYPKFRVQDVTDEWIDDIIDCVPYFLKDVFGEGLEVLSREMFIKHTEILWKTIMKDKVALICVSDDEDISRLAGFQMNEIGTFLRTEEHALTQSSDLEGIEKVLLSMVSIRRKVNIFKKYNVDAYMDAFAFFVKPEFRNQGIGSHIQLAKIELCRALGIKAIANAFGSDMAAKAAEKAGYELLYSESFSNALGRSTAGDTSKVNLPMTNESLTFMGIKLE